MTKVLFRLVVISLFLYHAKELHAADSVYLFKEANIKLTIPNSHWHLQPRKEQNGFFIYVFKRDPIVDSSNRSIIPNVAVLIEKVDTSLDVVTYSINKRAKVAFSVTKMFIHDDGIINYVNAVGYKGTYTDEASLNHTVYVVHAINEETGIGVEGRSSMFPCMLNERFFRILVSVIHRECSFLLQRRKVF